MASRKNLYVSGFVAASLSYIFNMLSFYESMDTYRWFVFIAVFLGLMYGSERFFDWAEGFEED